MTPRPGLTLPLSTLRWASTIPRLSPLLGYPTLHSSVSACPAPPHSRSLATSPSPYPVLRSSVDTSSPDFIQRAQAMAALEADLAALLAKVEDGGGEKARQRVAKSGRGKMLVRQR